MFEGEQGHCLERPMCRGNEGACHPTLLDLFGNLGGHEGPVVHQQLHVWGTTMTAHTGSFLLHNRR